MKRRVHRNGGARTATPTPTPQQALTRGLEQHQAGQFDAAERLYRDVLRSIPNQPDALHLLGVLALQRGRPADAVSSIQRAVRSRPGSAVFHGNLGVALQAVGRLDEARTHLERAVSLDASHVDAGFNLGVTLQTLGAPEAAVSRYQHVLALAPGHLGALRNLGNSLAALGRHGEAVEAHRRALQAMPGDAGLLGSLGASLAALGRTGEAIPVLGLATAAAPNDPDTWRNLGIACQQDGRTGESIQAYQHALALRPSDAQAWHSLGRALLVAEQRDEGIGCYRRALAELQTGPAADDAATSARIRILCDLGLALHADGRTDEAIEQYQQAIRLGAVNAETWRNLGVALAAVGSLADAAAALGRAVELDPHDADLRSKQIFALDLLPTTTLEHAYTVRRAWNEAHAVPLAALARPYTNSTDPARRLRIGYVSADFCRHSAATTFLAILEAHDPAAVEIICYAGNARDDDYTARFRACASRWHPMADLSDEALAAQIRADEIDVLVDLSSHSGGNRLPVFARKPAPVQVTAWGYATGTGLDAMDAFFADSVVVPPERHPWYAEEVVNLPNVICYTPPTTPPPITPLPALSRGTITFGSYNRPIKITPTVLETWARVLLAVPDSRLLLKPGRQDATSTRQRLLDPLVRHGVDPARVEMLGLSAHDEHMASFGQLDLQLDPFPHTGGVTTVEGLMMGIPCVTLLGERIPGRLSASFLTALGLDDLIAHSLDEYVAVAVRLAQNVERLAQIRGSLRERLLTAPIGNPALYTRVVEAAYRTLWERWCGRTLTPQPPLPRTGRGGAILPSPLAGEGSGVRGDTEFAAGRVG